MIVAQRRSRARRKRSTASTSPPDTLARIDDDDDAGLLADRVRQQLSGETGSRTDFIVLTR